MSSSAPPHPPCSDEVRWALYRQGWFQKQWVWVCPAWRRPPPAAPRCVCRLPSNTSCNPPPPLTHSGAAVRLLQTLACQGMQCLGGGVAKASARVAYCGLFFLSMLLCWILRDYAKPMLEKLPCALPPPCPLAHPAGGRSLTHYFLLQLTSPN